MKKLLLILFAFLLVQNISSAQMYYQNSNDLESTIYYAAKRQNVNPYVLEALTRTLMNNKAELSGFWGMRVPVGEQVSAESLAISLAELMKLCETIHLRNQQNAIATGKPYNAGPYDGIIKELVPPLNNNSQDVGINYYKKLYNQIIQREQKR